MEWVMPQLLSFAVALAPVLPQLGLGLLPVVVPLLLPRPSRQELI